jgi:hypothetical protein
LVPQMGKRIAVERSKIPPPLYREPKSINGAAGCSSMPARRPSITSVQNPDRAWGHRQGRRSGRSLRSRRGLCLAACAGRHDDLQEWRRRAGRPVLPTRMCRWPLVSCTPGTGSGGQPGLAHGDAPSHDDHRSAAQRTKVKLGASQISQVTQAGPAHVAYHRILVIGGDRSRVPPVAKSGKSQVCPGFAF